MFKWFNKNKDEVIKVEINQTNNEVKKTNNYKTTDNGDIEIRIKETIRFNWFGYCTTDISIPKSSIISHTKNNIVFKDYVKRYNHQDETIWGSGRIFVDYARTIESKENLIEYKDTYIKTYEYVSEDKCWSLVKADVIGTEVVSEKTLLNIFKEEYESKYKLIETEEEFNDYLSSTLDCNTWCRKKLYDKMKELGLGDGFINQFADLVGNDLNKYHAMIDLANETTDKDTLMYLYTYKFRGNK